MSRRKHLAAYILFSVLFALTLLLLISISAYLGGEDETKKSSVPNVPYTERPTIIIDAGHGGEDGGTVGKNGVLEKELNLTIASSLRDMLRAEGFEVVMTRETDTMLYDKNADYKGKKKMLDLAARLRISESYENCVFVSIHMNSFPEERYHGLQVYYSPNDENSALLADRLQSSVKDHIQPDNTRVTKEASKNIYLLDRIKCPAVLVECGFLSNREECALLCTEKYRQKLTLAIFCGICEYISEDNT